MNIEQIWQQYHSSLYQFLLSKVSSPEEAEDILQDVIIKSLKSINQLQDSTKLKSWLFQIAKNSVMDFYRSKARNNINNTDLTEVDVKKEWNTNESNIYTELEHCIQPFVQALPEAQQKMLIEIDLNGLSQKTFAEQHQLPYSTLKSQLKQSRIALKRLFSQCCQFEANDKGELIDFTHRQSNCSDC
ncbi:RNA polymerase sigma factor SigZ [Parashewanella tropica]|uniref:RNA polymerase sigma factor SigZ n=1 Tax=Parashewanella tropica TaxID=2547970 RepID=UPI00147889B2|nr:RNA polymerase sigma factor SigZ [Parashewanella tropica]